MNKKQKKVLRRIIIAAVCIVILELLPIKEYIKFVLYMIPYLVIGYDILIKAWKGIRNNQFFNGDCNHWCNCTWHLPRIKW